MTGARKVFWAGVTAVLWLNAVPALATHEVDHRFMVYGTVRDDQGRPVRDAKVIVVDPRLSESGMTAFTDGSGYYEAVLHLHNTDL
ncbi:MAG TPA: carboxypeptidase-like regulatory domain-containing protein, partial [Nitrospiria bacterium]